MDLLASSPSPSTKRRSLESDDAFVGENRAGRSMDVNLPEEDELRDWNDRLDGGEGGCSAAVGLAKYDETTSSAASDASSSDSSDGRSDESLKMWVLDSFFENRTLRDSPVWSSSSDCSSTNSNDECLDKIGKAEISLSSCVGPS
jgi:hypothetical protein